MTIMRGESIAVVSSNNSATANVLEKLKKIYVDYRKLRSETPLTKKCLSNNQSSTLPDMSAWYKNKMQFFNTSFGK